MPPPPPDSVLPACSLEALRDCRLDLLPLLPRLRDVAEQELPRFCCFFFLFVERRSSGMSYVTPPQLESVAVDADAALAEQHPTPPPPPPPPVAVAAEWTDDDDEEHTENDEDRPLAGLSPTPLFRERRVGSAASELSRRRPTLLLAGRSEPPSKSADLPLVLAGRSEPPSRGIVDDLPPLPILEADRSEPPPSRSDGDLMLPLPEAVFLFFFFWPFSFPGGEDADSCSWGAGMSSLSGSSPWTLREVTRFLPPPPPPATAERWL
jgi:hypothetical protein